jgi:hypothetical protein
MKEANILSKEYILDKGVDFEDLWLALLAMKY